MATTGDVKRSIGAVKPTVGRIVHYKLNDYDAKQLSGRRTTSKAIAERIEAGEWPEGAQAHVGNTMSPSDVVPLLIVKVEQGGPGVYGVNGQCFLDGNDQLWVQGAQEGDGQGQWMWPAIEPTSDTVATDEPGGRRRSVGK